MSIAWVHLTARPFGLKKAIRAALIQICARIPGRGLPIRADLQQVNGGKHGGVQGDITPAVGGTVLDLRHLLC